MNCTWCGKLAVQIVVHEGKVTWRRCEEHKLDGSLAALHPRATPDKPAGYIPGRVLTDLEEMLIYEVQET